MVRQYLLIGLWSMAVLVAHGNDCAAASTDQGLDLDAYACSPDANNDDNKNNQQKQGASEVDEYAAKISSSSSSKGEDTAHEDEGGDESKEEADTLSYPDPIKVPEFYTPVRAVPRVQLAPSHLEDFATWVVRTYTEPVILANTHFTDAKTRAKASATKLDQVFKGEQVTNQGGVVKRSQSQVMMWSNAQKPWHEMMPRLKEYYNLTDKFSASVAPTEALPTVTVKTFFRLVKVEIATRPKGSKGEDGYEYYYHYSHPIVPQHPGLAKLSKALKLNTLLVPASERKAVNLWVTSPGTTSQAHYDSSGNLFAQLDGVKRFLLFPPQATPLLYLHSYHHPLHRRSQVNMTAPSSRSSLHGRFSSSFKLASVAVLNPGDVLYIPPYWYHHTTSVDTSISMNGWSEDSWGMDAGALFSSQVLNKFQTKDDPPTLEMVLALAVYLQLLLERIYSDGWPEVPVVGSARGFEPAARFAFEFIKPRYALVVESIPVLLEAYEECPSLFVKKRTEDRDASRKPKPLSTEDQEDETFQARLASVSNERKHRLEDAGWDIKALLTHIDRIATVMTDGTESMSTSGRDAIVADLVEAITAGTLNNTITTVGFVINCLCT